MRVVRYHAYGGPEVLVIEEVPPPQPGPGQLLIQTAAIGASFVDTTMRAGRNLLGPSGLPGSPHGDVVGTVVATGPGAPVELVGQRVAALVARDAYADLVLADADWAVTVPDGVSDADATVLSMPGPVARGLLRIAQVVPGETVVVHAAAGGVGLLAVQLAVHLGARVLATAGSAAKLDLPRRMGADEAVVLDPGWPDALRRHAPEGVDVVLDSVGGSASADSLRLLAPMGRLVLYGVAGGLPELPAAEVAGLRHVVGFGIMQWRAARPDLARADVDEVRELVAGGRLHTVVGATFPLDRSAEAHAALEDRARQGRVLLTP